MQKFRAQVPLSPGKYSPHRDGLIRNAMVYAIREFLAEKKEAVGTVYALIEADRSMMTVSMELREWPWPNERPLSGRTDYGIPWHVLCGRLEGGWDTKGEILQSVQVTGYWEPGAKKPVHFEQ